MGTLKEFANYSGSHEKTPFRTQPTEFVSPSHGPRVVREARHVGRTLLWKTEDRSTESAPLPGVSTMCPVLVNQSESIRLDNQLRGWFRLDPVNGSNETKIEAAETPRPPIYRSRKSEHPIGNGNTALDHYTRPAVHSLTGSIYHMLIADQELRASKFG